MGDLSISHKTTGRPILLSPHFSISFLERFKLSSVFTNPYECYLFFSHAGRGNYVTPTPRHPGELAVRLFYCHRKIAESFQELVFGVLQWMTFHGTFIRDSLRDIDFSVVALSYILRVVSHSYLIAQRFYS